MLKTPYNHAVQACASGLKFGIMVEDNPFRLWKPLCFFFLCCRMHLFDCKPSQKKHRNPVTISLILASSLSLDTDCELHFSEADYLKAKLSHAAPVCNSRMVLRLIFSFPLQSQQQDFSSWDPIRAGVGRVTAHVLKMHLCDLVSVWLPPYHALPAKRAVISATQCTVDIFI